MAMGGAMMKTMMCAALVLSVAVAPRPADAAIDCNTVVQYLIPCFSYVMGGQLGGNCCKGIQGLYYNVATTTPDRQSVCNCLQGLARSYPAVNLGRAANLPGLCKVNIPYKISPSTDCARVR